MGSNPTANFLFRQESLTILRILLKKYCEFHFRSRNVGETPFPRIKFLGNLLELATA
jgi:hypothetical protein